MVHLASFPLLVSSSVLEITLNYYELTQQQRYSAAPERNYELTYGSGYLGGDKRWKVRIFVPKSFMKARNVTWSRASPRCALHWLGRCVPRYTRECRRTSAPPAGRSWDVHHPEARLSSVRSVSTGRLLSAEPHISLFVMMYPSTIMVLIKLIMPSLKSVFLSLYNLNLTFLDGTLFTYSSNYSFVETFTLKVIIYQIMQYWLCWPKTW